MCSALELDGLTPKPEDVQAAKAAFPDLTIHVLIRPRAGDFCYSEEELVQMEKDVEKALDAGADGIVIGCLTPEGDVDESAMERLIRAARRSPDSSLRISITFHRAFDRCRRPFHALERIIALGCDRILTSGQERTAEEGAGLLRALRLQSKGRIGILPGGGVTPDNAARILSITGCQEIHSSASVSRDGRKITSADKVTLILQAINHG